MKRLRDDGGKDGRRTTTAMRRRAGDRKAALLLPPPPSAMTMVLLSAAALLASLLTSSSHRYDCVPLPLPTAYAFSPRSVVGIERPSVRPVITAPTVASSSAAVPFHPPWLVTASSSSYAALFATKADAEAPAPEHTIQILMSDTGGGHRASANAIRDALDVLYPGKFECDIVDIYTDYGPFFPYDSYVPLYKIMAEYSFLWDAFYHFGSTPFGLWLNEFLLEAFCFDPFEECMSRPGDPAKRGGEEGEGNGGGAGRRADMVVSVHPLCQDVPLKIATSLDTGGKSRTRGRTTPFVTVVTDLGGAHPTWFNKGVDKCFVPSDVLYDAALNRGLKPHQLIEHGLPIRSGFWSDSPDGGPSKAPPAQEKSKGWFGFDFGGGKGAKSAADKSGGGDDKTKAELRDKLGLKQGLPTVLVVGGGDGMGGIVGQAEALGKKLDADADAEDGTPSFQMVVVCGKNEAARRSLESREWGNGVNVQVNGFVYNMDEYMRASDAIVTKAGPGTIAEASICGLPCMLSSYLPGQEAGNVPYVENAGFGAYSSNPTKIADTVSTWIESPSKLEEMKSRALEAARPSATLDIARDIAEMLFEHKKKGVEKVG